MAKAKSKLNYHRRQLRIPIEYKKKYAEIFSKDLMRISYLWCLRSQVQIDDLSSLSDWLSCIIYND